MPSRHLNLYTIPSGRDPLRCLVTLVASGFPLESSLQRPLDSWRILLPSQRSARRMIGLFASQCTTGSLLLPRIQTFSDMEEDYTNLKGTPPALPRTLLIFGLAEIVREWGMAHPNLPLARDMETRPRQALLLAENLADLIDQIETEDVALDGLAALYDFSELAGHRENIADLLNHLQQGYARLLIDRNMSGNAWRRNLAIHTAAARIASGDMRGPLIAAGSTGTNPATRALLKSIAQRPDGAVVLPGLDCGMEPDDWAAITPTHPQYGLKILLDELGASPTDVIALQEEPTRFALTREIMRPSSRTDHWAASVRSNADALRQGFEGVRLIEADDRHHEARCIALILRETLETPDKTAALVTPDRDLAVRVAAELKRWDITIDDSAGQALITLARPSLLGRLLSCIVAGFTPETVISLLHHRHFRPATVTEDIGAAVRPLDLAARQYGLSAHPRGLELALARALDDAATSSHVHPVLARIATTQWDSAKTVATLVATVLESLSPQGEARLSEHIAVLSGALALLSPEAIPASMEDVELAKALTELADASGGLGLITRADAALILLRQLGKKEVRAALPCHPRLAIYGLAEARMMQADVMVLGGLIEGKWPAQPDTGPWLNRPMRSAFGLTPPERDIGLTAHDFAEGLGFPWCYVTWPKRVDRQPAVPSRWILRLRTLLQGAGLEPEAQLDQTYTSLARDIDTPPAYKSTSKPQPSPAVSLRPRHFTVTDIEKLIRDPYHIFAQHVLRLQPLQDISPEPSAALRGILIHGALEDWNSQWPHATAQDSLDRLIAAGERHFAPQMNDPAIAGFWWPRFCRMAEELAALFAERDTELRSVFSEISGRLAFEVQTQRFTLRGRLDRLDIGQDGSAKLFDYKTGTIPTGAMVAAGFHPQLPLLAHMLRQGAFAEAGRVEADGAFFVKLSGGRSGVKIVDVLREGRKKTQTPLSDLAAGSFARLVALLESYLDPKTRYLPRVAGFKVNDKTTYDHLSRFGEWQLARDDGP